MRETDERGQDYNYGKVKPLRVPLKIASVQKEEGEREAWTKKIVT